MNALRNILVGVDCSPCSLTALAQAARLARKAGARLTVFHAIDPLVLADLESALARKGGTMQEELLAEAKQTVARMVGEVQGPTSMESVVVVGNPLEELLARAREQNADLLVLGVRGGGGKRHGAGTFSAKCVRKAPCKVLLVDESQRAAFGSILACVDFSDACREVVLQAARLRARRGRPSMRSTSSTRRGIASTIAPPRRRRRRSTGGSSCTCCRSGSRPSSPSRRASRCRRRAATSSRGRATAGASSSSRGSERSS
ncbi:MAG: universal stress protein [Planctomycetes bacterium]|nr:universal stress protein [Planctomycetota bacterium]